MKRLLIALFAVAVLAETPPTVQPWKRSGGVVSTRSATDKVSLGTLRFTGGAGGVLDVIGATGVNGQRFSVQAATAAGSAEVQLVPGASCVGLCSQVQWFNKPGADYERFAITAVNNQYVIDSTKAGAGSERSIVFNIGTTFALGINTGAHVFVGPDFTDDNAMLRIYNPSTGGAKSLILRTTGGSGAGTVGFYNTAASGAYNWLLACQYNVANSCEITPSTAVDGTTFSSPALLVKQNAIGVFTSAPAYTFQSKTVAAYDDTAVTGASSLVVRAGAADAAATKLVTGYLSNGSTEKWSITRDGVFSLLETQFLSSTEGTCDASNRGRVVMVQGGAGVADTFRICSKDAADAYAFRALY